MADDASPPPTSQRIIDLYAQLGSDVFGFVRSLLPVSTDDASDVCQRVFLEVIRWDAKNSNVVIENERAFVFRVARHHVDKHLGKLYRSPSSPRHAEPMEGDDLQPDGHQDDLEYLAGLSQDRRNVLRAMRRLGNRGQHRYDRAELQVIMYLRHWVQLTEHEICEVVGLSRGAVRRRLEAGLEEMKLHLQKIERAEPGTTQTSTAILQHWWEQLVEKAAIEDDDGEGS